MVWLGLLGLVVYTPVDRLEREIILMREGLGYCTVLFLPSIGCAKPVLSRVGDPMRIGLIFIVFNGTSIGFG